MGMMDKVASVEGGLQFGDRVLRWLPVIAGAGGSAVLGGWAGQATRALSEYAPASWIFGALVGACIFLLCAVLWYWMRIYALHLSSSQELAKKPDAVNPLDSVFTKRRIRLADFPTKFFGEISGKTFVDCDISGPAAVYMVRNCTMAGVELAACEFIAVKIGRAIYNAIPLVDVSIHGGRMRGVTFFVSESLVPRINQGISGVQWMNS